MEKKIIVFIALLMGIIGTGLDLSLPTLGIVKFLIIHLIMITSVGYLFISWFQIKIQTHIDVNQFAVISEVGPMYKKAIISILYSIFLTILATGLIVILQILKPQTNNMSFVTILPYYPYFHGYIYFTDFFKPKTEKLKEPT